MTSKLFTEAPAIHVIAGHQFVIPFKAERLDGGEVDLSISNTTIKWILADWGMPDCAELTLTNETSSITVGAPPCDFDVHLSADDTKNLFGQYLYQVELKSPTGDRFVPIKGVLIIDQRNQETV